MILNLLCTSLTFVTSHIGHPHVPQCETYANIVMLGTVIPAPADAG